LMSLGSLFPPERHAVLLSAAPTPFSATGSSAEKRPLHAFLSNF
jgi:hypothetical protein